MLHIGTIIKTNYDTGPYRIETILRGCTCPNYLDTINMAHPPPSRPHIHLVVSKLGKRGDFHLGGYDEETLCSVWSKDRLFVVKDAFRQLALPF